LIKVSLYLSWHTADTTPLNYDRYDPCPVPIRTTPRPGIDATDEELKLNRERDLQLQLQKDKKE